MAQAVALGEWDGSDIRLSTVVDNLIRLRKSVSRTGSRTTVMTLVVVAGREDEAVRARQAMHSLGDHHPARLIILRPVPDDAQSGVDARVMICGVLETGHPLTFDEVTLTVRGDAASHQKAAIEPFTLSDVPIVVWYPGALPPPAEPLLEIADTVLVDSKESGDERAFAALVELSRVGVVVDLSWERLRPWRQALAALFEGKAYLPFAAGVTDVEVAGKRGPRHLLAGWLASRLGTDRTQLHLKDDRHVQVVIHASSRERTGTFAVIRTEGERVVRAGATIEGGPHHSEVLALPEDSLAWSLAQGLTHLERDEVWERALAAAVALGGTST